MDINDFAGDPEITQFIAGFANDMVTTRRQDQQRAVAQQIQARQPQPGTITLSTRDLLDALARSNNSGSQVLGAMPMLSSTQHKEIPWALIAVLGIGVGLAVGISIAVLSKK